MGIVLLAAYLRPLWYDDFITISTFDFSWMGLIQERLHAGHSPLFFAYSRLGQLFGSEAWQLRLPVVVMVPATVLLLTGLMGALGLRRHLPAFWALAPFVPYWSVLGTGMRYMMPSLAVGALTLWMLVRFAETPVLARGAALAAAGTGLAWVSPSTLPLIVACLAFLVWESRASTGTWGLKAMLARAWPMLASILLSLPLLWLVRQHKTPAANKAFKLHGLGENLLETVFGDVRRWTAWMNIDSDTVILPCLFLVLSAIVMTRTELLSQNRTRGWRLLSTLLVGFPLTYAAFCLLSHNAEGTSRYVACFGLPAVLCLSIAWSSTVHRYWRLLFRTCLVAAMAVQGATMILDQGDRHRDAMNWLLEHHSGKEPVLITRFPTNSTALKQYRLAESAPVMGLSNQARVEDIAAQIRLGLAEQEKMFFLEYHGEAPILEAVKYLQSQGLNIQERHRRYNGTVMVGAIARDASQDWLAKLPEPSLKWGPGRPRLPFMPKRSSDPKP